jgi:4-hydroxybenzoate polyprenyltransferase
MANSPHLTEVSAPGTEATGISSVPATVERTASVWVSRLTGIVGLIILVIALLEWFFRHGHFRMILALFTVAMFCAILHSYVFEETRS